MEGLEHVRASCIAASNNRLRGITRFSEASTISRTIKLGIEAGTITTVQLGRRRMIPRVPLLRVFGINA